MSTHGEVIQGRCRSPNRCDVCAKRVAIENAEMLHLDAQRTDPPEVWSVLTTRSVELDMEPFYRARERLIKALRRRWSVEYACLLEFTTGYGPKAAGGRRPHWNILYKGIPASAIPTVRAITQRVWCDHVDAEPHVQYVGEITGMEGLTRYVALHFQKESQSPPPGFRGQRFNCSRGYFADLSRSEMREEAKLALADRALRFLAEKHGLEGDDAEDWIDAQFAAQGLPEWGLYSQRKPQAVPPDTPMVPVPDHICRAALAWEEREELIDWAYQAMGVC